MRRTHAPEMSAALVHLAKGPVYEEDSPVVWGNVLKYASDIGGVFALFGLSLEVDRAEKYAFVRQPRRNAPLSSESSEFEDDYDDSPTEEPAEIPPLVSRQPLSALASFLLLKLRERLFVYDADESEEAFGRLAVSESEIVEMCAEVLRKKEHNDLALRREVATAVRRVEEMGFLKEVKSSSGKEKSYEIRRIIKAFVDGGGWLHDIDETLDSYLAHFGADKAENPNPDEETEDATATDEGEFRREGKAAFGTSRSLKISEQISERDDGETTHFQSARNESDESNTEVDDDE